MDGYTFLNRIRTFEDWKTIPIIVITAYPEMKDIFLKKEVKECLLKPLKMDDFLQKIKSYLDVSPS